VGTVTLAHTAAAVLLSFALSLVMAYVYRVTHSGTSYSQSYVHTLVIMTVVVSLIMIIIGSNIARAFSLVGALSIIRFRSAIKETRDVAFIFMAMAIGMACGTRFYDIAILFTALMAGIVFFLTKLEIGAKPSAEALLKVTAAKDFDHESSLRDAFYEHLDSFSLLAVETAGDDQNEIVYTVQLKRTATEGSLLDRIRELEGCERASVVTGYQNLNV
jgi:uncharacterized membrane protein YhiD involved in acid resistance